MGGAGDGAVGTQCGGLRGRLPAFTVQVYGAVPPTMGRVPMYGAPTMAGGGLPEVMLTAAAVMVRVTGAAAGGLGAAGIGSFDGEDGGSGGGRGAGDQAVGAQGKAAGAGVPPVMLQVYGDVPPLTPMPALYGVPTTPLGSEPGAMLSGVTTTVLMTTVKEAVARTPVESWTTAVKVKVPATVGMPARLPAGFRTNPVGSVPLRKPKV